MLAVGKITALRSALEAEASVRLAYLFGSFARGDEGPLSDIDVAVWTDEPLGLVDLGAMGERLCGASGERVDIVDLRAAPPLLCRQVVAEGEPLLVRDALFRLDFELETVRRYEDTRPLRAMQQQLLKDAVNRGRAA